MISEKLKDRLSNLEYDLTLIKQATIYDVFNDICNINYEYAGLDVPVEITFPNYPPFTNFSEALLSEYYGVRDEQWLSYQKKETFREARKLLFEVFDIINFPVDYQDKIYQKQGKIDFDLLLKVCHINTQDGECLYLHKYDLLIYLLEKRNQIEVPKKLQLQTFFDDFHKEEQFYEKIRTMKKFRRWWNLYFLQPVLEVIPMKNVDLVKNYLHQQEFLVR